MVKIPRKMRTVVIMVTSAFLFSALTLLFGWQEGHLACKKLGVCLLVVTVWLELCMETFWCRVTQVHLENGH